MAPLMCFLAAGEGDFFHEKGFVIRIIIIIQGFCFVEELGSNVVSSEQPSLLERRKNGS